MQEHIKKHININDAELPAYLGHVMANYFAPGNGTGKSELSLSSPGASGMLREIPIAAGLSLSMVDAQINVPFTIKASTAMPRFVEMSFTFNGAIDCAVKGLRRDVGSFAGLSSFSFYQGLIDMEISVPPGQRLQVVKLRFSNKAFDDYCRHTGCVLPRALNRQLERLEQSRETFLQCGCFPPRRLRNLMHDIAREGFSTGSSSLGLEQKCADFARGMVNHLSDSFGRTQPRSIVSYQDMERVREARHILFTQMGNPPGLLELARMVGLNDYKLKTGFRQAYGMSVHETLTSIRMKQAAKLLRSGSHNVTEAALAVGCNNMGDFSMAFKRQFGISPGKMKGGRQRTIE